MATHSSILAWRIPWTEEPGGLQSTKNQTWLMWRSMHAHRVSEKCCLPLKKWRHHESRNAQLRSVESKTQREGSFHRKWGIQEAASCIWVWRLQERYCASTRRYDLRRKQEYQHGYLFPYLYSFIYGFFLSFFQKYVWGTVLNALGFQVKGRDK